MAARPRLDDDLEAAQREFLASKKAPAAKVVRVGADTNPRASFTSGFSPAAAGTAAPAASQPLQPQKVLHDIFEKPRDSTRVSVPLPPKTNLASAAPPIPTPAGVKPAGRKSLFAQRFDAAKNASQPAASVAPLGGIVERTQTSNPTPTAVASKPPAPAPAQNKEQEDGDEMDADGEEGLDVSQLGALPDIKSMSASEISAAHDEIRTIFSASSLAFLQKRARERANPTPAAGAAAASPSATTPPTSTASSAPAAPAPSAPAPSAPAPAPPAVTTAASATPTVHEPSPMEVCGFDRPREAPSLRQPGALPFPIDPRWGALETDKLQWTGDLQAPSSGASTNNIRFDFSGNAITTNLDVPTSLGLHHHGDEEELPGYTLAELVHLARSTFAPQRALSLETLTRILPRAWAGHYAVLTPQIVRAAPAPSPSEGIRAGESLAHFVADDNDFILACLCTLRLPSVLGRLLHERHLSSTVRVTACIKALLCCPDDELFADAIALLPTGLSLPPLDPTQLSLPLPTAELESAEEADVLASLVSQGVVGLLYNLLVNEEYKAIHHDCLAVLTRIARHNSSLAAIVGACPGLLDTLGALLKRDVNVGVQPDTLKGEDGEGQSQPPVITTTPTGAADTNPANISSHTTTPATTQHMALLAAKLVRVLCAAARTHAVSLRERGVLATLFSYFFVVKATAAISTEAFHTWQCCLTYGLCADEWSTFHPLLLTWFANPASWADPTYQSTLTAAILALSALDALSSNPDGQEPAHSLHFHNVALLLDVLDPHFAALCAVPLATASPLLVSLVEFYSQYYAHAFRVDPSATRTLLQARFSSLHFSETLFTRLWKLALPHPARPPAATATLGLAYRFTIFGSFTQDESPSIACLTADALCLALTRLMQAFLSIGVSSEALHMPALVSKVVASRALPTLTPPRVTGDMALLWQRWRAHAALAFVALQSALTTARPAELGVAGSSLAGAMEVSASPVDSAQDTVSQEDSNPSTHARCAFEGHSHTPSTSVPLLTSPAPSVRLSDDLIRVVFTAHCCLEPGWEALLISTPMVALIAATRAAPSDLPLIALLEEEMKVLVAPHIESSLARVVLGKACSSMMLPSLFTGNRLPLSPTCLARPLFEASLSAMKGKTQAPETHLGLVQQLATLERSWSFVTAIVPMGVRFAAAAHVFALGYDVYKDPSAQQLLAEVLARTEALPTLDLGDLGAQRHLLALFSFILEEYHTVSFADELLARCLLQFVRPAHASEYRARLFDCETALPLCRVAFSSPAAAWPHLAVIETDGDVLCKLMRALVSRTVTRTHAALYAIAIHHLACLVFGREAVIGAATHCYTDWLSTHASLVQDTAVTCVRALSDEVYGDLLRHRWTPGTLPDFPAAHPVDPARIAQLRTLCSLASADKVFAARHSA
eukprot:m.54097 g.54097  ORF g.54097 m.54097 type:complete len:1411 (+) comp11874_c1_seq2:1325-5557(+)